MQKCNGCGEELDSLLVLRLQEVPNPNLEEADLKEIRESDYVEAWDGYYCCMDCLHKKTRGW